MLVIWSMSNMEHDRRPKCDTFQRNKRIALAPKHSSIIKRHQWPGCFRTFKILLYNLMDSFRVLVFSSSETASKWWDYNFFVGVRLQLGVSLHEINTLLKWTKNVHVAILHYVNYICNSRVRWRVVDKLQLEINSITRKFISKLVKRVVSK